MTINESLWRPLFSRLYLELYDEIYNSINYMGVEPAPLRNWMPMPYAGLLAAQKFGVIIQHFSIGGNFTYFPMFDGPATFPDHITMSIAFVKNIHFIYLKLTSDCPTPLPHGIWSLYARPEAKEWEALYSSRIEQVKVSVFSHFTVISSYLLTLQSQGPQITRFFSGEFQPSIQVLM
ncbi:hypothetical protein QVD17_09105 [Tagetes erecta]|uniref:Uncharacterized protein n=1 Tax=Tagetes erecta TaxID=13708 RepID=A0AAD8P505_TARER|nr:hypothetical protein QVD17_09105 [Tagetes erecta]